MNIRTKEARTGDMIVFLICVAVILLCLLPMINLLAQSLSSADAVINGRVSFLPVINKENFAENDTPVTSYTDTNTDSGENTAFVYEETEEYVYEDTPEYVYEDTEDYVYSEDTESYSAGNSKHTQTDEEYRLWLEQRNSISNKFKYGATIESYRYVFMDPAFTRSMWWTAILTVICTFVSLAMTVLCSYPLTYDWLKGKTFINTLIIFTMYFSAGTIPNYILMKDMGLLDNPLVLIIPNCLSVFNMIILRSFFFGIPDSLRESAELDGANPFTVLVRIYLPLSTAVLSTLALFYAVGRWNGFSDALLYIKSAPQWVPIQLKLWQLIQNTTSIDVTTVEMVSGNVPRVSDAIKAAAIMFATIPILIVYPWLQRYFIEGVTIGAVKG
jgi:putative aldouronate transport system permease protein